MVINLTDDNLSDTAKEAVRLTFNPSGNSQVTRLKFLAAALLTEYEQVRDLYENATREASVAITHLQTASMWAVLAATK